MRTAGLVFYICLFLVSLGACKKGEADPAFSLRSRQARLQGDWKMQEGNIVVKIVPASGSAQETTFILEGKDYHVDLPGIGTINGIHTIDLKINDDGSFVCAETIDKYQSTDKGHWDFLSRSGTYKNKERVMFDLGSLGVNSFYIDAFNKGNSAYSYALRRLSKHEIILECRDEFISSVDGKTSYYLTSWFRFRH